MAFFARKDDDDKWFLDLAATDYMTGNKAWFTELRPHYDLRMVKAAGNQRLAVSGIGTIAIPLSNGVATFTNVLYVPDLGVNLLGVARLDDQGYHVNLGTKWLR